MEKSGDSLQFLLRKAWAISEGLGHSYVGTEHLLVALAMDCRGTVGTQLQQLRLSPQELMGRLLILVGRGTAIGRLPQGLSRRAARAIRMAAGEEKPLKAETLLLQLLRQQGSGAVKLLNSCAVDTDLLFTKLCEGKFTGKEQKMQNIRLLEQFGVDMVERGEKSDTVIGRQQEIETVLQILSRRQKNNPALIGEPGV